MEKGKDLVALMHKVMTEGQPPAEYRCVYTLCVCVCVCVCVCAY